MVYATVRLIRSQLDIGSFPRNISQTTILKGVTLYDVKLCIWPAEGHAIYDQVRPFPVTGRVRLMMVMVVTSHTSLPTTRRDKYLSKAIWKCLNIIYFLASISFHFNVYGIQCFKFYRRRLCNIEQFVAQSSGFFKHTFLYIILTSPKSSNSQKSFKNILEGESACLDSGFS